MSKHNDLCESCTAINFISGVLKPLAWAVMGIGFESCSIPSLCPNYQGEV